VVVVRGVGVRELRCAAAVRGCQRLVPRSEYELARVGESVLFEGIHTA
jgi:hypothetical protein